MIGNISNLTAPSGVGGITDMQPKVLSGEQRQRDIASRITEQEKNLAKAEADIERAKREEELNVLGVKAQAKQKEADDIRTQQAETKRKRDEFGDPEFHPTQENAVSLAQLFSLVATSGLLLGSSGKMSAMNSLAAMNGAMEGWQAGRADLYKKEVDKFNKETERRRRIREDLRQDLEDYMKLSAMDREAASLKQEEIVRKAGTSSIIGAYTAKGDAQAALSALQADERIEKDILNRQLKAQEEQRKMLQEERRYQQQLRANQIAERRLQIAEQAAADKRAAPPRMADRFGFSDIIATASNEATASLKNLVQMPSTVTSGIFGGRATTSLFTAPLDALINTTITAEDTQRYNAEINNLGKFIAQVQKGGRMVTNADIEKTSQAFRVEEGDKPLTKLTKLAQARQALERALEVRIASPNTPDSLKEIYRQNQKDIEAAVPFTVSDVNKFANERDKNKTFTQSFGESGVMGAEQKPAGGNQGWSIKEKK